MAGEEGVPILVLPVGVACDITDLDDDGNRYVQMMIRTPCGTTVVFLPPGGAIEVGSMLLTKARKIKEMGSGIIVPPNGGIVKPFPQGGA
jgi:hypothetical protein